MPRTVFVIWDFNGGAKRCVCLSVCLSDSLLVRTHATLVLDSGLVS